MGILLVEGVEAATASQFRGRSWGELQFRGEREEYPNNIRQVPHNIYSAILCIALNPQSGDFSGAILGVRSVALLHSGIGEDIREVKETAILRIVLFNNYNNRIPIMGDAIGYYFCLSKESSCLRALRESRSRLR